MLSLRGAHFIGISQQDVREAEPRLVTRRLVKQVGAVGEFPQLLLLDVSKGHSCTRTWIRSVTTSLWYIFNIYIGVGH